MASFYKYADSPTVYNQQNQGLTYDQYIAQGGTKDFSGVQTLQGSAPTLLTQGQSQPEPKVVPVVSSGPARQETNGATATILSNEQGGTNPSLNNLQNQVGQSVQSIQGNGLGLSAEEQKMLNELGSLTNQETASLAAGRSAIDANDPRNIVGSANSYTQYQQQRSQILQKLLEQMTNRQSDINTIANLIGPSTVEQETGKQLAETKAKLRDFDVNTMKGQFALEDEPIPMPIIGKQQLQLERQRTFERMGLSNQAMALTDILNSEMVSRQMKLEAAKFLFDAKRQEMSDALTLYKELAPENIATNVDQQTGEMTVIMRNPVTGETYKENLGRVATPQKWIKNVEYAQENDIRSPFYMRDGRTVINTNTGREYETVEQYLADGGVPDFSNVQKNFKTLKQQEMDFEREKFDFSKSVTLEELALNKMEFAMKQAEFEAQQTGGDPKATADILSQYLNQSKSFIQTKEAYVRIQAAAKDPSAAGDLALIFNYMKLLDPGSVVREGEFATAQNTAGVPDQIRNMYNRALNGERLNPNQRGDFVNRAERLYNSQADQQAQIRKIYEDLASTTPGVNSEIAVPDLSEVPGTSDKTPPPLAQLLSNPQVRQMATELQQQGITDPKIIEQLIHEKLGYKKKVSQTGSVNKGTARTDRHNNPTAFTTDIAKLAGLKLGVDYKVGDSFSNGKYNTALLLGDPITTTIRVIDKIGFYTQSGAPRWTYINSISQAKNWNKLSYNQKADVIKQMYKHEGGSALRQYFA